MSPERIIKPGCIWINNNDDLLANIQKRNMHDNMYDFVSINLIEK